MTVVNDYMYRIQVTWLMVYSYEIIMSHYYVELPGGVTLIVGPIHMVTSNMRSNLQNI